VKKITALIPVRKGSVRVKNKNVKAFGGTTLLEHKIKQLQKVQLIENIVVSSDCPHMLSIADSMGVRTHTRDEYFASAEATNSEFFRNLASSIEGDHFMYSPVTCPMISRATYHSCILEYNREEVRNLVTVASVKHHLWLDGAPLNYNIQKSPNSQDLPDIYKITYGACLLSREDMIKYSNVVTREPTFKILDEIESIDIDTEFDFMVAETIYNKIYRDLN
jgi:CMP-N-acetylneuraminic acid synthetase|tara:strand:- start:8439 stop:9101 length:663 start_codon:yes stop_codon:yes gene_type:complete